VKYPSAHANNHETSTGCYGASDTGNHVCNTKIHREGTPKNGNAVFAMEQDNQSLRSYVYLGCDSIGNDWYSGVALSGSDAGIVGSKILLNTQGLCADAGSNAWLQNNCIEGSGNIGIRVNGSIVYLGKPIPYGGYYEAGYNHIVGSDSTQLKVASGGILFGGGFDSASMLFYGGQNVINNDDQYDLRVVVNGISTAILHNEDWGNVQLVSDTTGGASNFQDIQFPGYGQYLFCSDSQSTLRYNHVREWPNIPYAPPCVSSCEYQIPPFHKQGPLPSQAQSIDMLPSYAIQGSFTEVYRFLGQYARQTSRILQTAHLALALEREYASRHRDSIASSRARVLAYLNACNSNASSDTLRAGLIEIIARARFFLGDLLGCEANIAQLSAAYPNSKQATTILPLLLSTAMARRNDARVNSILQTINTSSLDRETIRMAWNMKRVYDRVMPRAAMPKAVQDDDRWNREYVLNGMPGADGLALTNFPNPFNPTTEIAFYLPEAAEARLVVTNILGAEVAISACGWFEAGWHSVTFDGGSLPGGLYLSILTSDGKSVSKLMSLMK
jgi:hypothetical protein